MRHKKYRFFYGTWIYTAHIMCPSSHNTCTMCRTPCNVISLFGNTLKTPQFALANGPHIANEHPFFSFFSPLSLLALSHTTCTQETACLPFARSMLPCVPTTSVWFTTTCFSISSKISSPSDTSLALFCGDNNRGYFWKLCVGKPPLCIGNSPKHWTDVINTIIIRSSAYLVLDYHQVWIAIYAAFPVSVQHTHHAINVYVCVRIVPSRIIMYRIFDLCLVLFWGFVKDFDCIYQNIILQFVVCLKVSDWKL